MGENGAECGMILYMKYTLRTSIHWSSTGKILDTSVILKHDGEEHEFVGPFLKKALLKAIAFILEKERQESRV